MRSLILLVPLLFGLVKAEVDPTTFDIAVGRANATDNGDLSRRLYHRHEDNDDQPLRAWCQQREHQQSGTTTVTRTKTAVSTDKVTSTFVKIKTGPPTTVTETSTVQTTTTTTATADTSTITEASPTVVDVSTTIFTTTTTLAPGSLARRDGHRPWWYDLPEWKQDKICHRILHHGGRKTKTITATTTKVKTCTRIVRSTSTTPESTVTVETATTSVSTVVTTTTSITTVQTPTTTMTTTTTTVTSSILPTCTSLPNNPNTQVAFQSIEIIDRNSNSLQQCCDECLNKAGCVGYTISSDNACNIFGISGGPNPSSQCPGGTAQFDIVPGGTLINGDTGHCGTA